ncbi:ABC transporter substrate-binding protein [Prescottella sp. R16]|uniref:ABC transporter substrate-binding protein n=1 Tax=Prescottella sp. R16 TaxID=3064529 RepID=UPI00272E6FC1|nr:ABC transporter substrate-binding protein [Prescottella sp. R16]
MAGAAGGTEMAAVYDVLVRYDAETQQFEPQLAKAVEVAPDQLGWTITLRDGVTFSDGSPLDSRAVKWSIERFVAGKGTGSELWSDTVTDISTPDAATVVVTLDKPWSDFESMLASGFGLVVAPSSQNGDVFTPIGAGPFVVDRFAQREELVLNARPDYWAGSPNLEKLRFVSLGGDQNTLESLKSNGIQMAFLRSPEVVDQARSANLPGFIDTQDLGSIGVINNRPGRPGSDVRVRQAMAYAIDPQALDDRVNNGTGLPGSDMFPSFSQWHTDVAGLPTDPDRAKSLLDEAKADGYDGRLSFLSLQEPTAQRRALAVQAMLQAVGFTVTIDYVNSATDQTKRVLVDHDFDAAGSSLSLNDAVPFQRLNTHLQSSSVLNSAGYSNPEMDSLLAELQTAKTADEKRPIFARIQQVVNDTVPFATWSAQAVFVPWTSSVHGVTPTLDSVILFDKVWIEQ